MFGDVDSLARSLIRMNTPELGMPGMHRTDIRQTEDTNEDRFE
jgi:hypothetical protein